MRIVSLIWQTPRQLYAAQELTKNVQLCWYTTNKMKRHIVWNIMAAITALFIVTFAMPTVARAQTKEAYVEKSVDGTTLTFYYDNKRATRTGTTHGLKDMREHWDFATDWLPVWDYPDKRVTKAMFDASFKDYHPTSTACWFADYSSLKEIDGMENLNTDSVTDMEGMFLRCSALTLLDLSNFNTANVTNMKYMFYGCHSLISLDLSSFNTDNVTDMSRIFYECQSLTSLDVSHFSTDKVTDMNGMFTYCENLTSLNLSNFNTTRVTDMNGMFSSTSVHLNTLTFGFAY